MATRGWENVKASDLNKPEQAKRSKYGAVKKQVDGITFDSTKEANRYLDLIMMQRAGQITGLRLQPTFQLRAAGPSGEVLCGEYRADFEYMRLGEHIIEDVKSPATRTALYKLKKKIAEACHAISITEV